MVVKHLFKKVTGHVFNYDQLTDLKLCKIDMVKQIKDYKSSVHTNARFYHCNSKVVQDHGKRNRNEQTSITNGGSDVQKG